MSPRHFHLIACCLLLWGRSFSFGFDPASGDFSKDDPLHVRVLTYNVANRFISVSSADDEFSRLLQAINPDIIAFQEMTPALTTATIEARLNGILGDSWTVLLGITDGHDRNVLASRLPLTNTIQDTIPPSNSDPLRGVTAGLAGGAFGSAGFYVMCVHLKSRSWPVVPEDHQRRQEAADAIINWMRDARTAGEYLDLALNTPILIVGDFNLLTPASGDQLPYHASRTLIEGDIYDEGAYGADSPPDWDGSSLADAAPYNHQNGDVHTYSSGVLNPSMRLDRFYYTDSQVRVVNRAIINTLTMSPAALANAALTTSDTLRGGDHLPAFCDFALGPETAPGRLLINEFLFDDERGDDRNFVELINRGGRELNLDAPVDYRFIRAGGLADSPPGTPASDTRDLIGVIPPGGLFILYDSRNDSADIAEQIMACLPSPLQRQDSGSFYLNNGDNSALAIITRRPTDVSDYQDEFVEGYMYNENPAGGTHYMQTSNNLTISFSGDQATTQTQAQSDNSFSRNIGDITPNSFVGWTILGPETAGLPNDTPFIRLPLETNWTLYP